IANGLKKKIKAELESMLKDDREKYEKFFKAFGLSLKYGIYESYGMEAENLADLLLFRSAKQDKQITLQEYLDAFEPNQTEIYYACGESPEMVRSLPQYKYLIDKGYDVLLMTDNVDEFMTKMMNGYKGKPFKSITDSDINAQSEDEKKAMAEKQEENKDLIEAVKAALGDRVKEVRLSSRLSDSPAALTSEGPLSLEMEKVLSEMPLGGEAKAERILELNPDHPVFAALIKAKNEGGDLEGYAKLLYNQALMMAGLRIDDPAEFARAINALIVK
ncbi:MAG: molecular chaperone HtpG, partial [Clostridia bacterium]|nr:molecular chaperone HtpG [Clostridia bacterium]